MNWLTDTTSPVTFRSWGNPAGCSAPNAARRGCAKSGAHRLHFAKLTTRSWRRSRWRIITSSAFDMRAVLLIVTRANDALAAATMATQQKRPETQVKVVDLTAPEPDYAKLLEEIFAADSVAVW